MTTREKFQHLIDLKQSIESEGFQTFIVKPMYEEIDKLKGAYDCDTLKELYRIKGKKQGLKFLIDILKRVDLDLKNTKLELESSEEGQ